MSAFSFYGDGDVATNRIQFQAGMSLPAYLEQYGSEEQCQQSLQEHRWPNGYICSRCQA